MEYAVGILLALGAGVLGTVAAMDRDRAFYPTILIVVASYYDLFAVVGGDLYALGIEAAISVGFVALAVTGFRTSLWLAAAGLLGHASLDLVHGHLVANAGLPAWWPSFCASYDAVAGAYLAWRLVTMQSHPVNSPMQSAR